VALSTTSMAVVYAVMLETGLNQTEFGKGILGACFINDLGTVITLGKRDECYTNYVSYGMLGGRPRALDYRAANCSVRAASRRATTHKLLRLTARGFNHRRH